MGKYSRIWFFGGVLMVFGAALYFVGCAGGYSSATTSSGSTNGVTSNTCYRGPSDLATYSASCSAASFDGSTASWISSNFSCVQVVTSGGNYQFTTTSEPNHKSYYWSGAPNHESGMPSGTSANPNHILAQNYVVNIPSTPALRSSPVASGYDIVGIAKNGVAIFNNQAAPGDSLSTELATMDYGNGHPTSTGTYHYHIEPCYLSSADGNLVGVMRDGFPIFGRKEADGSDPVYDDNCTYANATSVTNCRPYPTQLPNFHCHSISGWSGPTCHYHVITTDPYIIEYYAGTAGSFTN
jgi:hypothetical protein